MKIYVRPVDLASEREKLLLLLQRNLPDLDHRNRFDWLYVKNPAGQPYAWFVCGDGTDEAMGVASVFPRFVWIGTEPAKCGQVGDFAVDAAFRSLGPALALQRATLQSVDEGALAFCYDCPPHDRGLATFRRMRLAPACRMARMVKPLRSDRFVDDHLPPFWAVRAPAKWIANAMLRIADRGRVRGRGLVIENYEGDFTEEFSRFDGRIAQLGNSIRSRRCADYLNWRYRLQPAHQHRAIVARRAGELVAFAVYTVRGDYARLLELVATGEEESVSVVLALAEEVRPAGVTGIEAQAVFPSGDADSLLEAGFRFRHHSEHVVPYARSDVGQGFLGREWKFCAADIIA